MNERRCQKARKRAIPFDCKGGAGHPGCCSPSTLAPTGNWLSPSTGAPTTCSRCSKPITLTHSTWFSDDDDFMCPDGQEQHQPAQTLNHPSSVRSLGQEIDAPTTRWEASDDIDTNLGADVERTGQTLLALLESLTPVLRASSPSCAVSLERHSRGLGEALDFYAALEEHEADASIDIFDRLAPGLAFLEPAIGLQHDPTARERITVDELREKLRQLPGHHEVWVAAPASPDGYLPLSGDVQYGHDGDPLPGHPGRFVVIGTRD